MSNVKDPCFSVFSLGHVSKKYGPRDVHRTVPELSLSLASHRCLRRAAHPGAASDPRRPDGRIRAMASSPSSSHPLLHGLRYSQHPMKFEAGEGSSWMSAAARPPAGVIERYKQSVTGWPRIFSHRPHPPKLLLLLIPLFLVMFPLTHPPLTNSFPNVSNLGVRWPAAAGALLASFTGLGIHQR